MVILLCRACSEEHEHVSGEIPQWCPHCGETPAPWKSAIVVPDPDVPYDLSERDGRMLRALWIDPERPS